MDPELCEESPQGSASATSQQDGRHSGKGANKSDLIRKMEEEVKDLLVILRDVGTEIDNELAREIDYKIARIKATRDAAINKPRGSKVRRYLIKGFGRALFHIATAFIGGYLTLLFIFGPW